MPTPNDWRPATLDVSAVARDAQLDRIEAKLDRLLSSADGYCCGHAHVHSFIGKNGNCTFCGKPIRETY